MTEEVILTSYYRPKPGGYCKRYFRAIRALLDKGAVVHYLAVEKFPVDHERCHFHKFPWPKKYSDSLLFWIFFHIYAPIFLLYLGLRYKITHSFAFGSTYAFVLQPLRILKGIPLTFFIRADSILNHRIKGRPEWIIMFDQFLEGMAIQGARIYGVSDALTNAIINRHSLFRPLKHGTLRNNIEKAAPVLTQLKRNLTAFACVGVLEKRKNIQILLQALTKISGNTVALYIYGTGPDEEMLKEQAGVLLVKDKVEFKGWVSSDTIWPEIDILVMPSLHEGAPNAVLEALSHGVPVLASNIAEHTEILPVEYLVPAESIDEWAKSMIELSTNTSLVDTIKRGQEEYSKSLMFDWEERITSLILEPD